MDETAYYGSCTLAELHDIARHLDKERYPQRYVLVQEAVAAREEWQQVDPLTFQEHTQAQQLQKQGITAERLKNKPLAGAVALVVLQYGWMAFYGIAQPLVVSASDDSDMKLYLWVVPLTGLFFFASIVASLLMYRRVRRTTTRRTACCWSLKALAAAPVCTVAGCCLWWLVIGLMGPVPSSMTASAYFHYIDIVFLSIPLLGLAAPFLFYARQAENQAKAERANRAH